MKNLCIIDKLTFKKKTISILLEFRFRKNYYLRYALIQLTVLITESPDKGKFVCGVFMDLQKAFDTVDHNILLSELDHYSICNRKQYVSVNSFKSNTFMLTCGVPQSSVLVGSLLFLMYINDLYNSIKFCQVHHFADNTSFLYIN